jgi:hypothetical protein
LAPQQDSVPAASAQVNALPTAMADADVVAVDADGVAEAGVGVAGVGVAGLGAAVIGADVAVAGVGVAVAGVGAAVASVGAAVVGPAVCVGVGSPLGADPPGAASGPLGPTSGAWDGTSLGPEHAATRIRDASAAAHRRLTASYTLGPHEPAPGVKSQIVV